MLGAKVPRLLELIVGKDDFGVQEWGYPELSDNRRAHDAEALRWSSPWGDLTASEALSKGPF